MNQLTFSPLAVTDISNIWDYTALNWGMDQADHYIDNIQSVCTELATENLPGRVVDIREGYLKYPVGKHMVYFRQHSTGIVVIRILHQSMDVEQHL